MSAAAASAAAGSCRPPPPPVATADRRRLWAGARPRLRHARRPTRPACLPALLRAAVKLVLVEESVADALIPLVMEGVKKLSVGM